MGVSPHSFSGRTELGLAGTGGGVVYLYSEINKKEEHSSILESSTPISVLRLFRLFRKTKEAMTKEIRIGAFLYLGILGCECKRYELVLLSIMIVDRIVGPK